MTRDSGTCVTITEDLTFVSLEDWKEEKEFEIERVFKEVVVGNFPNLAKDTNLWIQGAERVPRRMNSKHIHAKTCHSHTER